MSDVRSLEEVIAEAVGDLIGRVGPDYTLTVTVEGLRAWEANFQRRLRAWCLAPEQIERAANALEGPVGSENIARAALRAVMGDTP